MINKIKKYQDFTFVVLLIVITTFVYSYLFRISSTSLVGDAQRFNGYQAYIVKYSLTHFGQFGLWDQFIASGMSWISHPGGAHFSPAAWIAMSLFSDISRGTFFIFFIHALTASIGYYFLCRVLGLRKITGFFVAIVSVCNQYLFTFSANGWFEEFFGFTLLPFTVGLLWLSFAKRNLLYAVLGGFVMSLNFFSNSYYVFHYNAIAILWVGLAFLVRQLWFIASEKKKGWSIFMHHILSNAVFWLVTIGISAVKLLPLLEFRSISARQYLPLSIVDSPNGVMTFQFFKSLFRDFIIPAGHTNSLTQWANDLALAFIFLSAIYFLFKKTFKYGVFLALFVIGVWGYFAYRIPVDLYAFVYKFLPGFNSNNYPYRFMIIIYFAFLVCLGLGLDILIRRKNKSLAFFGIFFGAVIIYGSLFYSISTYNSLTYPQVIDVKSDFKKTKFAVERPSDLNLPPKINGKVSKNLLTDLSIIVKFYRPEGRVYSNFSNDNALVNHIMLEEEIPSVHPLYNPIGPTYQYSVISPSSQDSVEQTIKRFKVFSVLNTRFQYQKKENYDYNCNKIGMLNTSIKTTTGVCNYLESRLLPLITNSSGGIFYDKNVLSKVTVISNPVLIISDNRFKDFSGFIAKQIMFHPDFDERLITVLSRGSSYIDDYDLKTLKQFKAILLVDPKVKNKEKSDLSFSQYEKEGGKVIQLSSKWINYESLHVRSASVWGDKPAWNYSAQDKEMLSAILRKIRGSNSDDINIHIKKYTPEDVIFDVKTLSDNVVLQYSDSYYPGWYAEVDGKSVPVYMADGLVKAVIIKNHGTHTVRFYYSPDSLKIGGAITLATLVILLLALSFKSRNAIESFVLSLLSGIRNTNKYISNSSYRTSRNKDFLKASKYHVKNTTALFDNSLKFLPVFFIILFLLYIYGPIFVNEVTSAGDLPYYWKGYIESLSLPTLWNPNWPTGMGGNQSIILPLKLYIQAPIALFVNSLDFSWEIVEKIFLLLMFLVLCVTSSYYFTKSIIGSLIYTTNTWVLLVFSGGQMGIALAYSMVPFVVGLFVKRVEDDPKGLSFSSFQRSLLMGLTLSILVLFDQRIAYVAVLAIGLYWIVFIAGKSVRIIISSLVHAFIIPLLTTLVLHAFWILPLVVSGRESNYISETLPTVGEATFFSFATLSNSLSLLHPNWPENIFGKTSFMQPEFLIIPIIAYTFLLFSNSRFRTQKSNRAILFFALLGLVGAFLAKGVNEPLGGIYLWLFNTIPGFNLFRDPTKFYVLISLSYALIIPQVIAFLSHCISTSLSTLFKKDIGKKYIVILLSIIFIIYWGFTLRPLINGEVGGLFKMHPIPSDYVRFQEFIEKDPDFFRTLWVPVRQRFGYFSQTHPSLDSADVYKSNDPEKLVKALGKEGALAQLENMSVKYVVLPYDSEGELFLDDRKYSEKKYAEIEKNFEILPIFAKVMKFGKIVIGKIQNPKDHFFILRNGEYVEGRVTYDKINNSRYILTLKDAKEGDILVFSEKYDSGWIARFPKSKTSSTPFRQQLNSFLVPESGDYVIETYYRPEKFLKLGYIISFMSLSGVIVILFSRSIFKIKNVL